MTAIKDDRKLTLPATALSRPDFRAGSYLAAQDLQTEQRYRQQRLRRHNRYLHGWGVICGLRVVPVGDPRRPWAVQVCPGYGIDCCGDEILVCKPAMVDMRDFLWRRPHQPRIEMAYIGIRYVEAFGSPVPTKTPGCGSNETIYQPSRIYDRFQADVLWTPPDDPPREDVDICTHRLVPCPQCPTDPYLILARVAVPVHESEPITHDHIDHL